MTHYLLLINDDYYIEVEAKNPKKAKKWVNMNSPLTKEPILSIEFCCTDCKGIMIRGEEEATWCQECCDADREENL